MADVNTVSKVGGQKGLVDTSDNMSATLLQRSRVNSQDNNSGQVTKILSGSDGFRATLERTLANKISANTQISETKVKDLDDLKSGIEQVLPNNTKSTVDTDSKTDILPRKISSESLTTEQNETDTKNKSLANDIKDKFTKDGSVLNDLLFNPGKANLFTEFAKKENKEGSIKLLHGIKDIIESDLPIDKKMEAFSKINDSYIANYGSKDKNLYLNVEFKNALEKGDITGALKAMDEITISAKHQVNDIAAKFKTTPLFKQMESADKMQALATLSKSMAHPEPNSLKGVNEYKDLMFNPTKSKAFKDFCKSEFSVENHDFMMELKAISNEKNPEKVMLKLSELDKKYFSNPDNPDINVDRKSIMEFKEALNGGDFLKAIASITELKKTVMTNLLDTYSRFTVSDAYKQVYDKGIEMVFNPIKNLPPEKQLAALEKIIANSDGAVKGTALQKKEDLILGPVISKVINDAFSIPILPFGKKPTDEYKLMCALNEPKSQKVFEKYNNKNFTEENFQSFQDIKFICKNFQKMGETELLDKFTEFKDKYSGNINLQSKPQQAMLDLLNGNIKFKSPEGIMALESITHGIKANLIETFMGYSFYEDQAKKIEAIDSISPQSSSLANMKINALQKIITDLDKIGSTDGRAPTKAMAEEKIKELQKFI
jgi:hypothetical protein